MRPDDELPVPAGRSHPPTPDDERDLVRSGAELVELGERFFGGVFAGCVAFVGFASLAALALLPLRDSDASYTTATVPLVVILLLATPFAVVRARRLDALLRSSRVARAVLVAVAAALVAHPLRSELWWPSCALIMLLAAVVGLRGALAASLVVLFANLGAHLVAGDLGETPAVSIVGLWIGFGFWSVAFALFPDRLMAYVLRLNAGRRAAMRPKRVQVTVLGDATPSAASAARTPTPESTAPAALQALTARQLEVIALLADGLRYDEIGAVLGITEDQVQRHVSRAVRRFGVRNATELTARVVALGLVPGAPPGEAAA